MIHTIYSFSSQFASNISFNAMVANFQNRVISSIDQISSNRMLDLAKIICSIAVIAFSLVFITRGINWLFFKYNAREREINEERDLHLFSHSPVSKSPKTNEDISSKKQGSPQPAKKENNPKAEVLFEIKRENLESGLRGWPVGYCITSSVDSLKGLFYAGRPFSEINHWEPEQVIYLLYYGKEGTMEEVAEFSEELQQRAHCSKELIRYIKQLPVNGHPMKLFIGALLLAGTFEGTNQYREDCLNLIAKIPEIAATVINHHTGWGPTKPSQPNLGYMENFTQMLNVPNADSQRLLEAFKLFNILHYDHGGGNLSAFVGKAAASGLEDLYGSMAAAMCALDGPRHGGANQDCLLFVQRLVDELGEDASEEEVEAVIRNKLANNELIFGFGHAVLRVEDPRATLLYQVTQQAYPNHPLVKMAHLLRKVGPKVLKENPKISNPHPNVDAISGVMLAAAGFPYPEYYTILFGLARVVGIARQIVYEREEARNGKGVPIVRPKYLFKALQSD